MTEIEDLKAFLRGIDERLGPVIENAPDGSDASVLAYATNGLMYILNRILSMLPEDSVPRDE